MKINMRFQREIVIDEIYDSLGELQERLVDIVQNNTLPEGYNHDLSIVVDENNTFDETYAWEDLIANLETKQVLEAAEVDYIDNGDEFKTGEGNAHFIMEYHIERDSFSLDYDAFLNEELTSEEQNDLLSGLESLCANHDVKTKVKNTSDEDFLELELSLEKTYARGEREAAVAYVHELKKLLMQYTFAI